VGAQVKAIEQSAPAVCFSAGLAVCLYQML